MNDFLAVCSGLLAAVFGGDAPQNPLALHQVAARAIVLYVIGLAIVRIGKSRLLSRATPLDVLLGFILGSVLARGITGQASLSGTVTAAVALVGLHWLFTAIACHWHWFGLLFKGNSKLVIQNGQPRTDVLLNSHISVNDLEEQLRLRGIDDLREVKVAYKERNGEISVIRRTNPPRVIEVAVEAGVQTVRIEIA